MRIGQHVRLKINKCLILGETLPGSNLFAEHERGGRF
jgi:hypothetical protein